MKTSYGPHTGFRPRCSNRLAHCNNKRDANRLKSSVNWEHFYSSELGPLGGHGTWRDAPCPFHDDHKPSLRVNIEHGGFWCPVCGAKGDGVKFIQDRQGLTFAEALRVLEGYA